MTDGVTPFDEFVDVLDWDALPTDGIDLLPHHLEQAARQAQELVAASRGSVDGEPGDRQWRLYLLTLAVLAFRDWLGDRAPELAAGLTEDELARSLSEAHTRYTGPSADGTALLSLGNVRVCIVSMGSLTDEQIQVPTALLEEGSQTAQLLVLVEVLDEQAQARIHGYCRPAQVAVSRTAAFRTEQVCSIPLNQWSTDGDRLLLELRALALEALPATALASDAPPVVASWRSAMENVVEQVAQEVINTGLWLRDQLDQVAQASSWVLMPELQMQPIALRSGLNEPATDVVEVIQQEGLQVPPGARGAFRDLTSGTAALRLYAIAWDISDFTDEPEWSLLLILGAQPDAPIPSQGRLLVRDEQQVLVEQAWSESGSTTHLYAQVIGSQSEQFWVTVDFGHGIAATMPPFGFVRE